MSDPSKIFDGLLVLQYRSGKKKALNLLVQKHHEKLCRHAYWYTGDAHASQDIVQDCWSIVIKKLHGLQDPNLFGSWVMRIVTRKSLDHVNKRKKNRVNLNRYYKTVQIGSFDVTEKPEIQKLRKAISMLKKDQQTVLRLFYIQDYTLKEISEILEISVGTVKSRLFHAREKLKTILKK